MIHDLKRRRQLRVDTSGTRVEVLSDPYVLFNGRRYAPVIDVRVLPDGAEGFLYVSAESLSTPLERIRTLRGQLEGAKLLIAKESTEREARYAVDLLS